MSILVDLISALILLGGAFFVAVGGIGIFRLPDFYTRLHGAGVTDTLGAGLIALGLMFQSGLSFDTVKLSMIVVFLFVTGPTSCHALAQAARTCSLEPQGIRPASEPASDSNELDSQ